MYTIIMNDLKELVTTVKTTIYQREQLVDKVQFLFPCFYGDLSLSDSTAVLKYVDQAGVAHAEILQMDENLYKGKLRYTFPVDSDITRFQGNITIRITFTYLDMDTKTQYVMHTGETTITISPLKDYYSFGPDESLEFLDQLIGDLEAKIEATDKIAEIYDQQKADNITYEDSKLQLTSNGQKIGDAVSIIGSDTPGGDSEFEVVEF